jgi:hypothetical protein
MSGLKNFVCLFLLFFSVASICRGDEIIDKINAVLEEKYDTRISSLEEENIQKEQRISVLERTNSELVTEVQALRILFDQRQDQINITTNHSMLRANLNKNLESVEKTTS